jgi:hypothetical protein
LGAESPEPRSDRSALLGLDALARRQGSGRKGRLVATELHKLFGHLLAPLGVRRPPTSILEAIAGYRRARDRLERRLGVAVPRELETAVAPAFADLPAR